MRNSLKLCIGTVGLLGILVACGGGGGGGATGLASLGADFLAAFNIAPNGTPLDASTLTLNIDATADPFDP